MSNFKPDSEGNLPLTYAVSIQCHGRIIWYLGTGLNAVLTFADIAEAGIPEAKKIEFLWGNNYLVTMSGEALLAFLGKHYPDEEGCSEKIDPAEEYVIDCYDMS